MTANIIIESFKNKLYENGIQSLTEKKYEEAVALFQQVIAINSDDHKLSPDDCRLLSRCHKGVADACLGSTVSDHPINNIDILDCYTQSVKYLVAIPDKSNQDLHDLGNVYYKMGQLHVLFKSYDSAAKLYTAALEAFINNSELQAAQLASAALKEIIPQMKQKVGFKISFLDNLNTKLEQTAQPILGTDDSTPRLR